MEADVCIVGGGIMGLAAAERLTRSRGVKVAVIDRYGVGNSRCASNDDGRMFCYANGKRRRFVSMAAESLPLWRELESISGETLLVSSGLLLLEGRTENWAKFLEWSLTTLKEMEVPVVTLDEKELTRRYPQFRSSGGILDPGAAVLLARKSLGVLRSILGGRGVLFVDHERVTEVRRGDDLEVRTFSGMRVACKKVVMTAGAWSGPLLRKGLAPMTPTRQDVVYLRPHGDLRPYVPPAFPMFAVDKHYGIPSVEGSRVAFGYHGTDVAADPDAAELELHPGTLESYLKVLQQYVPGLADASVAGSKVCFYDMAERANFAVGPDPDSPDVIYGYGFSGHGFKFAPLIGRLISEIVLEERPSLDLEKLSPVR